MGKGTRIKNPLKHPPPFPPPAHWPFLALSKLANPMFKKRRIVLLVAKGKAVAKSVSEVIFSGNLSAWFGSFDYFVEPAVNNRGDNIFMGEVYFKNGRVSG